MSKTNLTSQLVNTVDPTVAIGGFRNRAINGSCRVRTVTSSVTVNTITSGDIFGGVNNYVCVNTAPGISITQDSVILTHDTVSKPFVRQTVNAVPTSLSGTNYWGGIWSRIPAYNCYDIGQKLTSLSFVFSASQTGTYCAVIREKFLIGSTPNILFYAVTFTVTTAVSPARYAFSIPVGFAQIQPDTSNGIDIIIGAQNTGSYATGGTNAWLELDGLTVAGVTAWTNTIGNSIAVSELQLEQGTAATAFERIPYSLELSIASAGN